MGYSSVPPLGLRKPEAQPAETGEAGSGRMLSKASLPISIPELVSAQAPGTQQADHSQLGREAGFGGKGSASF